MPPLSFGHLKTFLPPPGWQKFFYNGGMDLFWDGMDIFWNGMDFSGMTHL